MHEPFSHAQHTKKNPLFPVAKRRRGMIPYAQIPGCRLRRPRDRLGFPAAAVSVSVCIWPGQPLCHAAGRLAATRHWFSCLSCITYTFLRVML